MEIMKGTLFPHRSAAWIGALALIFTPFVSSHAEDFSSLLSLFGRKQIDPSIPVEYRRSFKTTRNDVVMVFDGTHWHSLSKFAVGDSTRQLQNFCDALTRSDREEAVIPRGFQYAAGGDGRVYLVKAAYAPRPQPVVFSKPRTTASTPSMKKKTSSPETVRKAIVSKAAAAPPAKPARNADGTFHTSVGNVLMTPKDNQWEGKAPADSRDGLSAPDFCVKAAASDRLKGRLPSGYTYVLLADDTLLAVPKDSDIVRAAAQR